MLAECEPTGGPYPFRVTPWDDIATFLNEMADQYPHFQHMADVVESVRRSDVVELLAGCTSMHDLVVVPVPLPEPPFGAVLVRAPDSLAHPRTGSVIVEHTAVTGYHDSIQRPVGDAVPLFWRFIIEKYGIVPGSMPAPGSS